MEGRISKMGSEGLWKYQIIRHKLKHDMETRFFPL